MPILHDHLINQVNQSIGREDIELYGATKVDKAKLIQEKKLLQSTYKKRSKTQDIEYKYLSVTEKNSVCKYAGVTKIE